MEGRPLGETLLQTDLDYLIFGKIPGVPPIGEVAKVFSKINRFSLDDPDEIRTSHGIILTWRNKEKDILLLWADNFSHLSRFVDQSGGEYFTDVYYSGEGRLNGERVSLAARFYGSVGNLRTMRCDALPYWFVTDPFYE